MEWPLVSVIIPNYNYGRFLKQAIDSVLAQTYPRVEALVVDDGSKDDSEEVLRGYGERIRWFRQQNQGVSAARNRGVRESHGAYLAFLDADDYWMPAKLEKQMELSLGDPELGLVGCRLDIFDELGVSRVCLDGMSGWVAQELLLLQRCVVPGAGSSLLVPRALFEEMGGFDERLSTSADWDFCYRAASRRRIGFVPELLVRVRQHSGSMQRNIDLMEKDMMLGFRNAFAAAPPMVRRLENQCYGNLHMTLAGSFFQAGQYAKFLRHAWLGVWLRPANIERLWGYPVRWWQRRAGMEASR
jgi:glycosyltransferase involved in cell wall biosynthesis